MARNRGIFKPYGVIPRLVADLYKKQETQFQRIYKCTFMISLNLFAIIRSSSKLKIINNENKNKQKEFYDLALSRRNDFDLFNKQKRAKYFGHLGN